VVSSPAVAQYFDRVLVFDRGMLVDDGTHETLATKDGVFKELVA
jgi:putative ABC transport system ATP-binding protein